MCAFVSEIVLLQKAAHNITFFFSPTFKQNKRKPQVVRTFTDTCITQSSLQHHSREKLHYCNFIQNSWSLFVIAHFNFHIFEKKKEKNRRMLAKEKNRTVSTWFLSHVAATEANSWSFFMVISVFCHEVSIYMWVFILLSKLDMLE